jgi:hypothetical protein
MLRLRQLRLAMGLFAAGLSLLGPGSAWAFTREVVSPDAGGNYTFDTPKQPADSDNHNSTQGTRPFGSNGPVVQFGVQQGPFIGRSNGTSLPDPYFRPLTNGN